jgi:hypothetical protein
MRDWLGPRFHYRLQSGGDLGQRLAMAFAKTFKRGALKVMAVGADCPGLDGECLVEAARHLETADVVLGPAVDGGYYLIGLRRPEPGLFTHIAWSSEKVLSQTLSRASASGLSVRLLPLREDVDDRESLLRQAKIDPLFAEVIA